MKWSLLLTKAFRVAGDGGRTWSATRDMAPVIGTVGPQLLRLSSGALAMVSGRPGIGLALSTDPHGEEWHTYNIAAEFNKRQPSERDRFSPAMAGIGPCVGHVCAGDNGPLPNASRHTSGCGPRCVGGAAPLPDGACPECPGCADFGGTAGEGTGYVSAVEVEPNVLLLVFDRFGGVWVNASGCPTLPGGRVDRRAAACRGQPAWSNSGVYAMRVRVG